MASHYFRAGCQFVLPTKEKYEKLQTTGFWQRPYEELKEKTIPVFNLWQGGKSKSNVLEYKKDGNGYHPTQKPVEVISHIIDHCSVRADIVVDCFCGSGTTIVACEQLGRQARTIESEPKYVAVTLERLKQMGLEPQLSEVLHEVSGDNRRKA